MFSRTFAWICLNTVTPRKVCGSEKWLLIFFIGKATCQNRKKMRVGKNRRWGMAKSTWFNWKALQFNKFVSYLCLPFSQRWRQWQCFLTYSAWVFWEDEGGGKVSSFQYIFFHHLLASRVQVPVRCYWIGLVWWQNSNASRQKLSQTCLNFRTCNWTKKATRLPVPCLRLSTHSMRLSLLHVILSELFCVLNTGWLC